MMRAAYEAWPDLDTYLREFRDNAVWHSPFAGDVSGKQAIRAYLSKGLLSVEEWTFKSMTSWVTRSTRLSWDGTTCGSRMVKSSRGYSALRSFTWMMRVWPGIYGPFSTRTAGAKPLPGLVESANDKAFDTSCRLSF